MDQATHNKIVSFIWGIADDVLRDLCPTHAMLGSTTTPPRSATRSASPAYYKPQPLRTLAQISADILAVEKEAEGLLDGLLMTDPTP